MSLTYKGEIKRTAVVTSVFPEYFHAKLTEHIRQFGDLRIEVHYKPCMHPNGKLIYSALLIGRARADE